MDWNIFGILTFLNCMFTHWIDGLNLMAFFSATALLFGSYKLFKQFIGDFDWLYIYKLMVDVCNITVLAK